MSEKKSLLPFQIVGIEREIDEIKEKDLMLRKEHMETSKGGPIFWGNELVEGIDASYLIPMNQNRQRLYQLGHILRDVTVIEEYNSFTIDYGTLFQTTTSYVMMNGEVRETWYMLVNSREGIQYLPDEIHMNLITDDAKLGKAVKGLCTGQRFDFMNPRGDLVEGVITKIATEEEAKAFLTGIFPSENKVYKKR